MMGLCVGLTGDSLLALLSTQNKNKADAAATPRGREALLHSISGSNLTSGTSSSKSGLER